MTEQVEDGSVEADDKLITRSSLVLTLVLGIIYFIMQVFVGPNRIDFGADAVEAAAVLVGALAGSFLAMFLIIHGAKWIVKKSRWIMNRFRRSSEG